MEIKRISSLPEMESPKKRLAVTCFVCDVNPTEIYNALLTPDIADKYKFQISEYQAGGIMSFTLGESNTALMEYGVIRSVEISDAVDISTDDQGVMNTSNTVNTLKKASIFFNKGYIFGIGHTQAIRAAANVLSMLSGNGVDLPECDNYEVGNFSNIADKFEVLQAITIKNTGGSNAVTAATLRGKDIEHYLEYNVVTKSAHKVQRLAGKFKIGGVVRKLSVNAKLSFNFETGVGDILDFLTFYAIFADLVGISTTPEADDAGDVDDADDDSFDTDTDETETDETETDETETDDIDTCEVPTISETTKPPLEFS